MLHRTNTYSGVIDFKDYEKIKKNIRTANVSSVVLDSTAGYTESLYTDTVKIYKNSLMEEYFENNPSDLKNQDNWRNLFMYKAIKADNIGESHV